MSGLAQYFAGTGNSSTNTDSNDENTTIQLNYSASLFDQTQKSEVADDEENKRNRRRRIKDEIKQAKEDLVNLLTDRRKYIGAIDYSRPKDVWILTLEQMRSNFFSETHLNSCFRLLNLEFEIGELQKIKKAKDENYFIGRGPLAPAFKGQYVLPITLTQLDQKVMLYCYGNWAVNVYQSVQNTNEKRTMNLFVWNSNWFQNCIVIGDDKNLARINKDDGEYEFQRFDDGGCFVELLLEITDDEIEKCKIKINEDGVVSTSKKRELNRGDTEVLSKRPRVDIDVDAVNKPTSNNSPNGENSGEQPNSVSKPLESSETLGKVTGAQVVESIQKGNEVENENVEDNLDQQGLFRPRNDEATGGDSDSNTFQTDRKNVVQSLQVQTQERSAPRDTGARDSEIDVFQTGEETAAQTVEAQTQESSADDSDSDATETGGETAAQPVEVQTQESCAPRNTGARDSDSDAAQIGGETAGQPVEEQTQDSIAPPDTDNASGVLANTNVLESESESKQADGDGKTSSEDQPLQAQMQKECGGERVEGRSHPLSDTADREITPVERAHEQESLVLPDNTNIIAAHTDTIDPSEDEGYAPAELDPSSINDYLKQARSRHTHSSYKYTSLDKTRSIIDQIRTSDNLKNEKYNFYGVVVAFTLPSRTKKADWMMQVSIIDETIISPPNNDEIVNLSTSCITLCLFTKENGKLPALLQAGDIIRIHRASVQEYESQVQLLSRNDSSFAVIRKKPKVDNATALRFLPKMCMESWDVIATAKRTFTFEEADANLAQSLWVWGQIALSSYSAINVNHANKLSDIVTTMPSNISIDRDLTVLVSLVIPIPGGVANGLPLGFLRVWDGTGESSDNYCFDTKNETFTRFIQAGDPSPPCIMGVRKVLQFINKDISDENKIAYPSALCGKVTNVAIWERAHWEFIRYGQMGENQRLNGRGEPTSNDDDDPSTFHVKPGSWIRLRNVSYGTLDSIPCIMVRNKSRLTPFPSTTFDVKQLMMDYKQRMVDKDAVNSASAVLPVSNVDENDNVEEIINNGTTISSVDDNISTVIASSWTSELWKKLTSRCRNNEYCIAQCLRDDEYSSSPLSIPEVKVRSIFPERADPNSPVSLKSLCVSMFGENFLQFSFRLFDDTGELDVIVPDNVANDILGLSAKELNDSEQEQLNHLAKTLKDIMKQTHHVHIIMKKIKEEKIFVLKKWNSHS